METTWFCLVALTLTAYVLLDGFDLGAGIIHLLAARNERERRQVLASIGPVWDGNEVWLIAGGGSLYFAFPRLYAASFSGFYLALMVVLWLLMLRGISIELRNHLDNDLWRPFWDVVFCGASALLAICYGTALGNVVRGVPLDQDGFFFLPFWTDFQPGANPGILDWYTVLVAVAALVVLTLHGALWVALKASGELQMRSRKIALNCFAVVCVVIVAISYASFRVQPQLAAAFSERPWIYVFPLSATAGLIAIRYCLATHRELWAFLGSSLFISGLMCSVVFGLYPLVLPVVPDASRSLTIYNSAAPHYGLTIGLAWWIPAFLLSISYSVVVYRHFWGKVSIPG